MFVWLMNIPHNQVRRARLGLALICQGPLRNTTSNTCSFYSQHISRPIMWTGIIHTETEKRASRHNGNKGRYTNWLHSQRLTGTRVEFNFNSMQLTELSQFN
jgi:hypothetical protein